MSRKRSDHRIQDKYPGSGKKAQVDRDKTIASLYNGTYIVYENVKVSEFLEYWIDNDLDASTPKNKFLVHSRRMIVHMQ